MYRQFCKNYQIFLRRNSGQTTGEAYYTRLAYSLQGLANPDLYQRWEKMGDLHY